MNASEIRYRRLFESAKDGILILNAKTGKILDVNPFLSDLLGYSKENLIKKAVWEIGFLNDIIENKVKFSELQRNKYVRYDDLPLETSNGEKIHVEFVSNVYMEGKHEVIQCNIRDITERNQAEEIIRHKTALLEAQLNSSIDGILIVDPQGKKIVQNQRAIDLWKIPPHIAENEDDQLQIQFVMQMTKNPEMFVKKITELYEQPEMNSSDDVELVDGTVLERYSAPVLDKYGQNYGRIWIFHDITERTQAEHELIKAKEKAEESDRLKSAFLANMSHEIRTPMNGILGFTELLKEPHLTGKERHNYITIIEKSGTRMLNIINDIINISKIESGQMEISVSTTNVSKQIEYIYTFFKPETKQKNLLFTCKNALDNDEAIIKTDSEKVYAILTNLVKNAIKFTQTGSIEFGYDKSGETLTFFVKDTGIGISQKQKEFIFERFRSGSESLIRNYEGAGLGLSISKAYAEILGGKLWFESEVGKGSTFYFSLPGLIEPETEKVLENLPSLKEKPVKKIKILLVEDDPSSAKLLKIILKNIAKEIILVQTGIESVDCCRNNPDIDLILMDIQMPVMDGYDATRQIRKFNKDVIIIAQTAYALNGDKDKAMSAGCNYYITKPIKQAILCQMIENHFELANV